jgi:hypothetical protein
MAGTEGSAVFCERARVVMECLCSPQAWWGSLPLFCIWKLGGSYEPLSSSCPQEGKLKDSGAIDLGMFSYP